MKTKNENKTSSKADKKVEDTKFCQKFNDAKNLEHAYNELQRDYTRKCQELASYKRLEERIIEEKKVESLKDILNTALDSIADYAVQNVSFASVPEDVKLVEGSQDLNKIDDNIKTALSSENDIENIEKDTENIEKIMKNTENTIKDGEEGIKKGEDNSEKVALSRENIVNCTNNIEKDSCNVENIMENIEKDAENAEKSIKNDEKDTKNIEKGVESVENDIESIVKGVNIVEKDSEKIQNFGENVEKSVENVENLAKSDKTAKLGKIYEMPDWSLKVLDFFEANPDAREFSEDIASVLISDDGVASLDNGLLVAYSIAKSKRLKSPESLLNDEEFVSSKILSSEDIKNRILESFLGGVMERKKSMPTFSSSTQSGTIISSPKKPKTLDDARSFLLGSLLK